MDVKDWLNARETGRWEPLDSIEDMVGVDGLESEDITNYPNLYPVIITKIKDQRGKVVFDGDEPAVKQALNDYDNEVNRY